MKLKTIALLSCILFAANVGAETVEKTINVVFSDYTAGVQNAINEKHDLGDGLVIYTNNCWFTDQLRIYSNPTMGYVVSEPLLGTLTNVTLNAAASDKSSTGKFEVYGSVDGSSWDLIKVVSFNSTSYANYRITFSKELNYKCFKIGIASTSYGAKLRLKSMSVTFLEEIVDTYDISIRPYEDCCTIFVPKHPQIRPVLEKVLREEEKLPNAQEMIDEAVDTAEIVTV